MAAPMKLAHLPVGLDAVSWSEDNRIALSTSKCVIIFSLQCDPSERNGNFVFTKSMIKSHADVLKFDVGINLDNLNNKDRSNYLVQSLHVDKTLFPPTHGSHDDDSDRNGFKLVRWSPAGTQRFDSMLLACLALDHRLTVYKRTSKKGNLTMVADLSLLLCKLLPQRGFSHINEEPHLDLPTNPTLKARCMEFKRRVYMLAAVTMDWSSIFGSTSEASEHDEVSFSLLAVAMKSGHVAIWKFRTPSMNEADVSLYSVFDSGYRWTASLSWCRFAPLRNTSHATKGCLAVGDREGRISVWSLHDGSETTVKSFSKCLDVWPDKDLIAVSNMAWTQFTPTQDSPGTATLVATKGLFLMAFLIDLSSMTMVRRTHIPGQHTIPATSLCVSGNMVLTTSTTGAIHRAVVDWTRPDGVLKMDILESPGPNVKSFGIALSSHGLYIACPSTIRQGKKKPYPKTLNFFTVGKMDAVSDELLDCQKNLSRKTDLLEFLRQTVVNTNSGLPQELESITDGEAAVQAGPGGDEAQAHGYTLRLKRFLVLMRLSRACGMNKDTDAENGKEEQIQRLESDVQDIERELMKLHIITALLSWQQMSTSQLETNCQYATSETTALLLMADWLSMHTEITEEPIRGLITEVYQTVHQSTEVGKRESCDLCGEIVAFTSAVSDACPYGHRWSRCQLSLRLCQTTSIPRACLGCAAVALVQQQSDSVWLRNVLQQCCSFCASMFVPS